MSTNIFSNFLDKLTYQMDRFSGKKPLNAIYIGNGGETLLCSHFDFSNHVEDVLSQASMNDISDLNTLIIVGGINRNQTNKLKALYNELGGTKKYVIQVRGCLSDEIIKKSYFLCHNVEEILPVDLKYNRYPINMDELFSQIRELKDGIHES